jgi:2-methylcitrate dehydratase PrpD
VARVRPVAEASLAIPVARMRVRLHDGRVLDVVVRAARGTPGRPVSREEVEEKLRRLAAVVLPPARIASLLESLRALAALPDAAALAALTCP